MLLELEVGEAFVNALTVSNIRWATKEMDAEVWRVSEGNQNLARGNSKLPARGRRCFVQRLQRQRRPCQRQRQRQRLRQRLRQPQSQLQSPLRIQRLLPIRHQLLTRPIRPQVHGITEQMVVSGAATSPGGATAKMEIGGATAKMGIGGDIAATIQGGAVQVEASGDTREALQDRQTSCQGM